MSALAATEADAPSADAPSAVASALPPLTDQQVARVAELLSTVAGRANGGGRK